MQVTRHHEGVYQCSASNGVGSKATAKINLRVLREFTFIIPSLTHSFTYYIADKPEVTAEEATVFTGVGHQAVLVCNVHSSPEAELVWYRGSLMLENDNRMYREDVGTRRSLVIHHVMEEEFTAYRCQATNDLGSGSATITISGQLDSIILSRYLDLLVKSFIEIFFSPVSPILLFDNQRCVRLWCPWAKTSVWIVVRK